MNKETKKTQLYGNVWTRTYTYTYTKGVSIFEVYKKERVLLILFSTLQKVRV